MEVKTQKEEERRKRKIVGERRDVEFGEGKKRWTDRQG